MLRCVCLFALLAALRMDAQDAVESTAPTYRLVHTVDEVSLTFSAADAQGRPVNDLKLDELALFDNGRPPRGIVAFRVLKDLPIRAGILMDMSQSMQETRAADRAIAIQYAEHVLRQQTDMAFVMAFDSQAEVVQSWTSNMASLALGIRNRRIASSPAAHLPGTSVYDAVYRACFNQFKSLETTLSGNFILLFSDGEDNASRVSLQQTVDMCQHAHTAIYAFPPPPKAGLTSGRETLAELARESGGRVFRDDESAADIAADLRVIEADLRNQYLLTYRPPELKRDGAFHQVELNTPERVGHLNIRTGYYAPPR